jgi:hypothetical protein
MNLWTHVRFGVQTIIKSPGVYDRRCHDARARDRRHYRDLQLRGCAVMEAGSPAARIPAGTF